MSRLALFSSIAALTLPLYAFNGCAPRAAESPENMGPPPAPAAAAPAPEAEEPARTAEPAEPAPSAMPPRAEPAPAVTADPPQPDVPAASGSAPPAAGGLDVANANITMGSVTVDGLTMTDFACQAGGGLGALLAGPTMAGMLSKKKAALKACSPKGGTARVRWTAAGGKITKVESKAQTPQIEACVVKAVSSVPATMDGTCAATIDLGK